MSALTGIEEINFKLRLKWHSGDIHAKSKEKTQEEQHVVGTAECERKGRLL